MKKTIAFHTLGCKVNRYETDAVAKTFADAGYKILGFDETADVYVINTCTVTGEADRKSRQLLRSAKTRNQNAIVVAMGCHVELSDASSYADILVGNKDKIKIIHLVEDKLCNSESKNSSQSALHSINEVIEFEEMGIVTSQEETRAYIKIEDGCNNFCSYCAIPLARGRVRSRNEDSVLKEAKELAKKGFKEIVLTGIHVCSYGADFNKDSDALIELTGKIALTERIERIRFGSLEPQSITESFISKASLIKKLCPHFHLSLQSGSDTVLKRMNRRYTTAEYEKVTKMLRNAFTNCTITTDIITGFPGETDIEHKETMEFCRKINFLSIHVFRFSERKGTKAALMPSKVNSQTANQRSKELIALAQNIKENHYMRVIGKHFKVLIEKTEDGYLTGYTENYIFTKIIIDSDNPAKIPETGSIKIVEMTGFDSDWAYAKIITG